jgi:hypothetical protein
MQSTTEHPEIEEVNTTVALIQALIPLGLQAASEALIAEVTRLSGPKHRRIKGFRALPLLRQVLHVELRSEGRTAENQVA